MVTPIEMVNVGWEQLIYWHWVGILIRSSRASNSEVFTLRWILYTGCGGGSGFTNCSFQSNHPNNVFVPISHTSAYLSSFELCLLILCLQSPISNLVIHFPLFRLLVQWFYKSINKCVFASNPK